MPIMHRGGFLGLPPRFRALATLLVLGLSCALAGCSNIDEDEEDTTFHIRAVNLIPNSPSVEFYLDDTSIGTVGYGQGSASHAGPGGALTASLQALRVQPLIDDGDDDDDDDSYSVGQAMDHTFAGRTDYTLVAYGDIGAPQMLLTQTAEQSALGDDKIAWQILNAAPNLQPVDVYITAALADVSSATYAGTAGFGQQTGFAELTVHADPDLVDQDTGALYADLTIELRAAGTAQTLYRFEDLRVSEQNRIQLIVADDDGAGPARAQLIALRSDGSSEILRDADNDARVRFVHVSADTPALDVLSGSSFQTPIAQNIGFQAHSDYLNIANGAIDLIGTPAGNPSVSAIAFIEGFNASANQHYSVYAIGRLADDLDATVLSDTVASIPQQGSIRFLHAAPSLKDESLDMYLTRPGQAIDFTSDDSDASDDDEYDDDEALKRGTLDYRGALGYFTALPGQFEVQFYRSGTATRLLGPLAYEVKDGVVETFVLTDSQSGTPEVLEVQDAAP